MIAGEPLYIGADMDVPYLDAQTEADGTVLTALTVTWELRNAADTTTIASGSCAHVATGNYRGFIPRSVTVALTPGTVYLLRVRATGGGYDDERLHRCLAQYRTRK